MRVDRYALKGEVQQFAVSTTAVEEYDLTVDDALARLMHRMATTISKRKNHSVESVMVYPSFLPTDELGSTTLWSGSILWQKDVNP